MALDLVYASQDTHAYDVILLDLDMPILNGFEACIKMCKFFDLHNDNVKLKNSKLCSGIMSMKIQSNWATDLSSAISKLQIPSNENESDVEANIDDDDLQTTRKMISNLYDHLKLRVMDSNQKPLIYAFSALVNDEVMAKTKAAGFEDCLMAPLTLQRFESGVMKHIQSMAMQYVTDEMDHESFEKLKQSLNN